MLISKSLLIVSLVVRMSLITLVPFLLLFDTELRKAVLFFLLNVFVFFLMLKTSLGEIIIRADSRAQVLITRLVINSLLFPVYLLNFAALYFYNSKVQKKNTEVISLERFNFESPYRIGN